MNRHYILLFAIGCSVATVFAQSEDVADAQLADSAGQTTTGLAMFAATKPDRKDIRVFPTHPMPNGYRGDNAISMPNAYRGDNCVPMPNLYREKPTRFITVDSIGTNMPDSVLMDKLEKLKDQLKKEQRPKDERP